MAHEGITKRELETKRAGLITIIDENEIEEGLNNAIILESTAKRMRLRAEIVFLKNDLVMVDKLIGKCKEITEETGGPEAPGGLILG